MIKIAYFITPHGFGHASRACAVMESIRRISPNVHFEIFTTVPRWFFFNSLIDQFTYHSEFVDVGLVQKSPLEEDLDATLESLNQFAPFSSSTIDRISTQLSQLACSLVICDISPLGLSAAKNAGIPSVLVENFTWDWIYEGYLLTKPDFSRFISFFREAFSYCTYHIQTEPLCEINPLADLYVPPISRKPRKTSAEVRSLLGIPDNKPAVMITMGGIRGGDFLVDSSSKPDNFYIILPGSGSQLEKHGNRILLPHQSNFFHPDLINASNIVISKLGYSTIAECYYAGIPLGYVTRDHFLESLRLEDFVKKRMRALAIKTDIIPSRCFEEKILDLLKIEIHVPSHQNGSELAADFIDRLLKS